MIDEQPLFLHPEVDQPEQYFIFLPNGKMDVHPECSTVEKERARKMLLKFFNDGVVEEQRSEHINSLRKHLTGSIDNFQRAIGQEDYDSKHIELAFFDFFDKLFNGIQAKEEFSLLNQYLLKPTNFGQFFLSEQYFPYGAEVKKLVVQALQLYIHKYQDNHT